MLNIDKKKLKLLLERRKKLIEKRKGDGLGDIISSVSLMITLIFADFSDISIIEPLYFIIIAWGISIAVFAYGIYIFIKSITNIYTIDHLYSEIADIDPKVEHAFNIVVIRNCNENCKYLVFKSKRWGCWLFPNYHCSEKIFQEEKELEYIKKCLKRDINIFETIEFKYIGNEISEKYSAGDKISKKYHFHYFLATDIKLSNGNKKSFHFNGKKYCWKTLDNMYADKKIVKKNNDVLDYVRRWCDIS